jgi:hypothetical protein
VVAIAQCPVPVNATECGEPCALSVMTTEADIAPAATGLKVTNTAQCWPTARDGTQAFCSVKSSACDPARAMEDIKRGAVPLLVKLNACLTDAVPMFWLAKFKDAVFKVSAGAVAAVAVPVNAIERGLPALSVMTTEADIAPAAMGLKVTNIAHRWPTASDGTQAFCSVKSSVCDPARAMEDIKRGAVPLLIKLVACFTDAVSTCWLAKFKAAELNVNTGAGTAVAVPVNAIDCGEPSALSVM